MRLAQTDIIDFVTEDDFYHFFQPIYCLKTGESQGLEALLRAKGGTPEAIFEQAKKTQVLYQLDTQSIHKALSTWYSADGIKNRGLLFLNVLPSTILNANFPIFINQVVQDFKLPNQQIVFELNETEQTFRSDQSKLLKQRISLLKRYGFLIAIDDIGKGWSSLSTLIDFDPHFAKLDRYFSKNLSTSKKKQMMIEAVIQYCNRNNIQLVLEGIERQVDLKMAKTLGIPLVQGYLFGKPQMLKEIKASGI
ncbi:diguanylate phosphodiesterase [Bacillus sp. AFS073361]|uniref:EAL domain-containing protein n=1 Tax=Bacillus sp. AFS073361 TaxID=2033511 RepID=UPI000BF846AE|nr:EAL domain-containing protein [Bacillus sp. AFS073361]PFP30819.1 diguanylate phosphodiesterase [Bacillus sp. AFS073361]